MDGIVNKNRKRPSVIREPMLKKVFKTMPHIKENIPEQSLNYYSVFTSGLKKVLGVCYLMFCVQ